MVEVKPAQPDGQRRGTLRRSCNNGRGLRAHYLHTMTLRRTTSGRSSSFPNGLKWVLLLISIALASVGARAQEQQQDEAPSRVGRVANVAGQLFFSPEDRATEWSPIELNYPISGGDNLWLSGDGRAEIDFGAGQLRIAGNSNVHVSRLDEHEMSFFVAQGRAIVALRTLDQGDSARIDTPNTQVELLRPGLYRIDVSDDRQETTLIVREGEANVAVAGGYQQVLPGQTARLAGTTDVVADVRNGSGLDGFDTWSANRDRIYARARSTPYVSREMVGSADLDEYGTWQNYPEYGAVWFPTAVAVDWAPYRDGHWVSVPVWGWTWVDYAPWGYAPFHYGRWAYIGGRWGWCPGTYVRRPAWSPAMVAWVGGNGWSVSASAGGPVYGWVPLGWRDPYVPWWRNCGSRCWSAYNRPYAVKPTDRTNRPSTYVNYGVPGAITAVGGAAFASGKPVAPNRIHVPPTVVATAPVLGAAPPVKPLSVAPNAVRPGNGVPPPASTIQARTKPMLITPGNPAAGNPPWAGSNAPGAITSAPPGRASNPVAPPPNAVMSAPPGGAATSAPPGRAVAPGYVKPAPIAMPPGSAASNAPTKVPPQVAQEPLRTAPQVGQEPSRGRSMREGGPPPGAGQSGARPQPMPQPVPQPVPQAAPRAVPQGVPMPRPAPQAVAPAPQAGPVPQPQAVPPPQQGNAPPRAEHGQGRPPEKPAAPGHPQPAAN